MCHSPRYFTEGDMDKFVALICDDGARTTDLGTLDALTNLLKFQSFRQSLFGNSRVMDKIYMTALYDKAKTASKGQNKSADQVFQEYLKKVPAPVLYKSMFCMWLLSFDADVAPKLAENKSGSVCLTRFVKDA